MFNFFLVVLVDRFHGKDTGIYTGISYADQTLYDFEIRDSHVADELVSLRETTDFTFIEPPHLLQEGSNVQILVPPTSKKRVENTLSKLGTLT